MPNTGRPSPGTRPAAEGTPPPNGKLRKNTVAHAASAEGRQAADALPAHFRIRAACDCVRGEDDRKTLSMDARKGACERRHSLDAGISSTGHSCDGRTGWTQSGSVQPMACPSMTMKSGLGPQIGQRAVLEGIVNVGHAAVPSLTVSCRRKQYDRTSADMCRVAAVYVERPVMANDSNLSTTPRVKPSHSRGWFFRRMLNKASALP